MLIIVFLRIAVSPHFCLFVFLVQLLLVKEGGVDRLQGNKVEQSWTLVLEQVHETFLAGRVLLTHNLKCVQL